MARVLIVDDQLSARTLLQSMLEAERITVVGGTAEGAKALEMIATLTPDIVLTDLEMSQMDGLALISIIRNQYPKIKIIVVSAYDDQAKIKSVLQLGVNSFILKCDLKPLIKVIKNLENGLVSNQQQNETEQGITQQYPVEIIALWKRICAYYLIEDLRLQLPEQVYQTDEIFASLNLSRNTLTNITLRLSKLSSGYTVFEALNSKLESLEAEIETCSTPFDAYRKIFSREKEIKVMLHLVKPIQVNYHSSEEFEYKNILREIETNEVKIQHEVLLTLEHKLTDLSIISGITFLLELLRTLQEDILEIKSELNLKHVDCKQKLLSLRDSWNQLHDNLFLRNDQNFTAICRSLKFRYECFLEIILLTSVMKIITSVLSRIQEIFENITRTDQLLYNVSNQLFQQAPTIHDVLLSTLISSIDIEEVRKKIESHYEQMLPFLASSNKLFTYQLTDLLLDFVNPYVMTFYSDCRSILLSSPKSNLDETLSNFLDELFIQDLQTDQLFNSITSSNYQEVINSLS
jgi:YesN/AraC family two-component response regulator